MVEYLEESLPDAASQYGRFFINVAYENLPKEQMLKITEKFFENF